MTSRKTVLLRHHRRKKRVALVLFALALCAMGFFLGAGWIPPLVVFVWIAHEVWFSDHLFYAPATDYLYRFDERAEALPVDFSDGCLTLAAGTTLAADDTLILATGLRAGWAGRLFDPAVIVEANMRHASPEDAGNGETGAPPCPERDCQTFERGARGVRYLNLTGFAKVLETGGLRISGRYCRLEGVPRLWRVAHPDYRQKRLLIVAPHADDAELAAFGLYSQAKEVWIATLTAGEIEAEHYRRMGLSTVEAARLKGRLRAWDSIAVPLWAGVPAERAIQLGYFCLRLPIMREAPAEAVPSCEADLCDTRFFRVFNRVRLRSDRDGIPSWNNLLADLREIIQIARPEVIVLPHPSFDPHPDHVAAGEAVREALADSPWQPEVLLHYANHLHDNDRWPMGEAHAGVALPPCFTDAGSLLPWSLPLTPSLQTDKAMALAMVHDLAPPLSFKKRLRRVLQRVFAGRKHPPYGENEYFRKAVRRHELFWVETGTGKIGKLD
ncbi:MAG: PIG-L family deacetylase [Candidatus Accumulibacter sp.]|jgi:LmbE family N-acetylglucosaminyl deacetylase|nr:PIG-L family deacetylase [Accumulibacter sp.]